MARGGDNRGRLLLIILVITSLFLITLDLRGVSVISGLKTGTQSALSPVQNVGSIVLSPVRNFFSDIIHLGRTRSEMEALREENGKLLTQLRERRSIDAQLEQLQGSLDLAGKGEFKVVNARVISQGATTSFTQTITIDAGSDNGIRPNMTVINSYGLIGVVKTVYPSSALISLTSDPSFRIGVRVAGSQQIGILAGQGTRKGVLQLLDNQSNIKVGDILVARGSVNNRPFVPGVPVGEVTSVDNAAGAVTQTADVRFFADFSAISVVSVVLKGPVADPRDTLIPAKPIPTPIPTVTVFVTPSQSPSPNSAGSD
jgi:rod shape-determining protein MreC